MDSQLAGLTKMAGNIKVLDLDSTAVSAAVVGMLQRGAAERRDRFPGNNSIRPAIVVLQDYMIVFSDQQATCTTPGLSHLLGCLCRKDIWQGQIWMVPQ